MVSLFHVFVVAPLAARNLWSEQLNADRTYGWDEKVGTTIAVACGYVHSNTHMGFETTPEMSELITTVMPFQKDIFFGTS